MPKRTVKRWPEEDLDLIFTTFLPTEEGAKKLGKIMDRTPESIEHAWRWAASSTKKRNETLGSRGKWAERCRKAKVRNGWVL